VLRKLGIYVCVALMGVTAGCSSMSPEVRRDCLIGVGAGALAGGGLAAGTIAASNGHSRSYEILVPVGAAIGALVGGALACKPGQEAAPPPPSPPAPPPPAPPPPPPPAPEKIILRGVHFDFDKSNIRPQDAAVLDEAAETLKSHPNVSVDVNGYCDSIGTVRYNLKLSERRSDAVVRYLADHGVAENRLRPHGFGKTNFIATNKTKEGRAQNRRVELVPNQ
jgi:outer membrane protein OmpA-like peptidoglycan-associated protein